MVGIGTTLQGQSGCLGVEQKCGRTALTDEMEPEPMNTLDILLASANESTETFNAQDPNLRASMVAMQRAAKLARLTAIEADTAIFIMRKGKLRHFSAAQLRLESNNDRYGARKL